MCSIMHTTLQPIVISVGLMYDMRDLQLPVSANYHYQLSQPEVLNNDAIPVKEEGNHKGNLGRLGFLSLPSSLMSSHL